MDRYRIVSTLTNEETDAARRIQKLSRGALHRILARKEKAARKIQLVANRRLLAKHRLLEANAVKIQSRVRAWIARRRRVAKYELRQRLQKQKLTAMDCSRLLDLLTEWEGDRAKREEIKRQATKIQRFRRQSLGKRVERVQFRKATRSRRSSSFDTQSVSSTSDALVDIDGCCVEDLLGKLWGLSLVQAFHRGNVIDEYNAKYPESEVKDFEYAKLFRIWNIHRFGYITRRDTDLVLRKNGLQPIFGRNFAVLCKYTFGRGSNQSYTPRFLETRKVPVRRKNSAKKRPSSGRRLQHDEQQTVEKTFLRKAISEKRFPVCCDQFVRILRRYELDLPQQQRYILHAFSSQHRELSTIVQRILSS